MALILMALAMGSDAVATSAPASVPQAPRVPILTLGAPLGPVPLSSPATWVTSDDYPPDALQAKVQGITAFRLVVDTAGAVSGCEVVAGSGSAALDETTCQLLSERAYFKPAMDKDGHPVPGYYRSRVRWVLPPPAGHPGPGILVRREIVEVDGQVTHCEVTAVSGSLTEFAKVGPEPCPPLPIEPYYDVKGKAVRKGVVNTMTVSFEGAPD